MVCLYLLPFQAAAIVCDLCERKIPNALITGGFIMGMAYQWSANGPPGLLRFAGGILAPLVLLGALHYFRMLGAGDIKLLMMTGGFFDVAGSIKCVCLAFLTAGVYAIEIIVRQRILRQRLNACLYFSIPVLVGSLLFMGGLL